MLTLDFSWADKARLGDTRGLDIAGLFAQRAPQLAEAVQSLQARQHQPGAWCGWLGLGHDVALADSIEAYVDAVRSKFENVVILGIGGSSLGGYALLKALLHPYWNDLPEDRRNGFPRYFFLENVDSDQITGLLDVLDVSRTLFLVVTKSGTTSETMSQYLLVQSLLETCMDCEEATRQLVAITDPKQGLLREIVGRDGLASFDIPPDVGGRFSVFSAVGLLPAALMGLPIRDIQRGIQDIYPQVLNANLQQNPAAQAALVQVALYEQGMPISVFMPYSARLAAVSDWYVQLWAESLGKRNNRQGQTVHVGPTPLRAVGVTDQHAQVQLFNEGPFDKVVTFVSVAQPERSLGIPEGEAALAYLGGKTFTQLMQAEFEATRASLAYNGRPSVTLQLPTVDAYHVGQLLFLLEVQTALAGSLLNVDPFDQPGVELGKRYTYALMGRPGFEADLPPGTQTNAPVLV
jgi:glucose-6-phosphate isomerase